MYNTFIPHNDLNFRLDIIQIKNTENDVKIHHLEAAKAENKAKIGHLEAKNAAQDKEINELRTSQNTKLEKPSSLKFLVNYRPK